MREPRGHTDIVTAECHAGLDKHNTISVLTSSQQGAGKRYLLRRAILEPRRAISVAASEEAKHAIVLLIAWSVRSESRNEPESAVLGT